MDNTALHTFWFHCPAALRSVVLLGSWDNFAKPYLLKLDTRRGRCLWKGCFTFADIICDGDLDNLSPKRDGPLKMGGTYWYYYKVDGEEESHNPTEPSTTFCPLLPGQRLNVLEIPHEGHRRSSSANSDVFTRNPGDRYLTPVPPSTPRPLPSPQLGDTSTQPYNTLMALPWASRSASYPPADRFLSPNVVRHARSASASPLLSSTPLLGEFKGLKEKLVSKRSRSRSRSETKELEIGLPVLISTTIDHHHLISPSSFRPPPSPLPRDTPLATDHQRLPALRKQFAPLGSHPVDPVWDATPNIAELSGEQERPRRRPQSHMPFTVGINESDLSSGRVRANSADTRRTEHGLFSNAPWLSSPEPQHSFDDVSAAEVEAAQQFHPAPVLRRPSASLELPFISERPTSSHGEDCSSSLRSSSFDKALPALPRYFEPEPLFVCNDSTVHELPAEEPRYEQRPQENQDADDFIVQFAERSRSHFSTWSSDSLTFSYPNSDDEAVQSPTFSSLTSDCSSPRRLSTRFSYVEQRCDTDYDMTSTEGSSAYLSASPPQLDQLRISTFGPNLFNVDIQHTDPTPHRKVACFGLGFQGFQGYSLPDDGDSKSTITETTLRPEPTDRSQRESSASHLERLMDEFGYLGDAVV
ncbi:hypothetical protein P153DRAFT_390241 [Dothidotthia symphoricarpi CBS 119687]|uniref:Uncharacterized protein n=1 Tax=Dothidotthia symphoricarpi CBS 119687 TaxID=1392245 RepID=A0A6A6A0U2_9PLEO|nr:uncharacterized protein P153DRAFT_390241 [Dothidotthia symphoricarpi CBS 119687]KAF2124773.1 hypothetical protein P153DRAFT_390241 [Dothidotthia symphoricarpi CBS 119687]